MTGRPGQAFQATQKRHEKRDKDERSNSPGPPARRGSKGVKAMKESFRPLYLIDSETIARHPRALDIVEHLSDCRNDPKWHRTRACWSCENWVPKHGFGRLPFRPGVGVGSVTSCSGCWYSMMDVDPDREHDVSMAIKLRLAWLSIVDGKAAKRGGRARTRGSSGTSAGFSGRRRDRAGLNDQARSSFRDRALEQARVPCPTCLALSDCEYWWMLGKNGEVPTRWRSIRCSACGTTRHPLGPRPSTSPGVIRSGPGEDGT